MPEATTTPPAPAAAPAPATPPPAARTAKAPATTKKKGPGGREMTYFEDAKDLPTVTYAGKAPVMAGGIPWKPGQSEKFWSADEAASFADQPGFTVAWPSGNPLK